MSTPERELIEELYQQLVIEAITYAPSTPTQFALLHADTKAVLAKAESYLDRWGDDED